MTQAHRGRDDVNIPTAIELGRKGLKNKNNVMIKTDAIKRKQEMRF